MCAKAHQSPASKLNVKSGRPQTTVASSLSELSLTSGGKNMTAKGAQQLMPRLAVFQDSILTGEWTRTCRGLTLQS